ncbi:hypothetical protein [Cellulomonas shaoxiangyii]|uniref:Uncharacterized protein n=1 Tax=Cellulomonas shaoxiangyii TaxID=2566013 RepID=A0A4P7SK22_9CELL|nr:hypothetical protein [Cellulomonas shaoxiangyii]QCB94078.1 hypothetical protein E5225_11390 [Cellulomonas shaoxiangyii]TGY83760.1 hypothetical protein E5226_11890 [Cellulomonas shaoxiangyii]
MGRHAGGAQPTPPWPRRLGAAALRWGGRLLLGVVAAGVVLLALRWTGVTGTSARALAAAAGLLVVVAAALAATVPPAAAPPTRPDSIDGPAHGPGSRGR